MVAGDFNIILSAHEKKVGGSLKKGSMEDFANMMVDCSLEDAGQTYLVREYDTSTAGQSSNHLIVDSYFPDDAG